MKKMKFILDVIMIVIMILLMRLSITGLKLHEILGLIILVIFLVHKVININFIKAFGKNLFNKKIKLRSKIIFILDSIILIFMIFTIFSGVVISKIVIPNIINIDSINFSPLHRFFSWWLLILLSVHIGLHLDSLFKTIKIKFLKSNFARIFLIIIYIIITINAILSFDRLSIYNKLSIPNNIKLVNNDYGNQYGQNNENKHGQNNRNQHGQNNENQYNKNSNTNSINRKKSNLIDIINIMLFISFSTYVIDIIFKRNLNEK